MLEFQILKNFYNNHENPETRQTLSEILSLKLKGYTNKYGHGVLPLSTSDFVSDHLSIGYRENGRFIPVISYRTTDLEVCKGTSLEFPIETLIGKNNHAHATYYQSKLNEALKLGKRVFYASSLTYNPEFIMRNQIDAEAHVKAMHAYYHTQYINEPQVCFAAGTVKFKMDRYYLFSGFEKFHNNGEILDPVKASFVKDDATELYFMETISQAALDLLDKTLPLWDRISILGEKEEKKTLIAA